MSIGSFSPSPAEISAHGSQNPTQMPPQSLRDDHYVHLGHWFCTAAAWESNGTSVDESLSYANDYLEA